MELKFCYPGVGYSVESILEFTKEGQTGFWSEPVFFFFPQIDREGFLSGTTEDRRRYLTGFFAEYAAQMKEDSWQKRSKLTIGNGRKTGRRLLPHWRKPLIRI